MSNENNKVSDVRVSTENNRNKKAERREAKAARKAANKVEDKKSRPNNILLAVLIFGVIAGMFAFIYGYDYFTKPASIEKYMEDNGIAEMYSNMPVTEYTTMKVKAEGNLLKVLFTVAEDAPKEELEQLQGKDGKEYLKSTGAYLLTSMKPATQGFSGTVKVGVKQGDKTINYVKMTYRQAKKYMKEEEKKAAEEAEAAEEEPAEDAEQAEGITVEEDAAE